jgi:hypothetical protein
MGDFSKPGYVESWEIYGRLSEDEADALIASAYEAEFLRAELTLARGAMTAQDGRERAAGERCGVRYELWDCDWPDAVADVVLELREDLATQTALVDTLHSAVVALRDWLNAEELALYRDAQTGFKIHDPYKAAQSDYCVAVLAQMRELGLIGGGEGG